MNLTMPVIMLIFSAINVAGWTLLLSVTPRRKRGDHRYPILVAVAWTASLATLVGALDYMGLIPVEVHRAGYAALRVVLFIVLVTALITWRTEQQSRGDDDEPTMRP